MMIRWIGEQREVPKVGLCTVGSIKNVPEEIGQGLVKQGLAVKVKQTTKKGE
ncbi:MAG TPA: hypothetical protein PLM29_07790 [Deltaproteobacteria bacterium]|nr:hypothetical protein [Deltaproteobacteria bacterium]